MISKSQKNKPVFFVVGAAKSGTSSLYHYLEAHPDIHMCPHKDVVCYFCRDYGMPVTKEEYIKMLLPEGEYKCAGDVCHVYLSDETAAENLHKMFPDAKIIMILRNPADKAFSQYNWLTYHGYEYVESFEEALEEEDRRLKRNMNKDGRLIQGSVYSYQYFHSGLYSEQIIRYKKLFDDEKILYIKFDDFSRSTKEVMKCVYDFLGLEYNETELKRYNEKRSIRSVGLQYFFRSKLRKIVPKSIFALAMRLNTRSGSGFEINPKTRKYLLEKYRDDLMKTSELTGLDLSSWLKDV